jgi:hypothetical protein
LFAAGDGDDAPLALFGHGDGDDAHSPPITAFILLRDPLERVVSHCFWDEHALPPLEGSVEHLLPPNMTYYSGGANAARPWINRDMTRCSPRALVSFAAEQHYLQYLSGGTGDPEHARRTLRAAAVVGAYERYDDFVARVTLHLQAPSVASFVRTHRSMTSGETHPRFSAYNETVRAWVRHAAAADVALYDYALQLPSIAAQRGDARYNATLATFRAAQQRADVAASKRRAKASDARIYRIDDD